MDDLKLNSQSQIIQFTSRIETFYQRWQQERPSNAIVVNENQQEHFERCLLVLQNFRNEWNGMMQDRILLKYAHMNFDLRTTDCSINIHIFKYVQQ